jgi:membrane-associated phospholipid phosphatase
LNPLDQALFPLLNRGAANPFFDWLMPRITNLHQTRWFIWAVLLTCLVLAWKGGRRTRVWVLCAALAVGISDPLAARVVKRLLPRDRPCQTAAIVGTVRLVPGTSCPGSKSFPSNHASNMMALAGVCWWFGKRTKDRGPWTMDRGPWTGDKGPNAQHPSPNTLTPLLWFLLPLVIGYSRIYLGYHYPTDVLGGWLLGAAIAAGVVALVARPLLHNTLEVGDTSEQENQEVPAPPAS